MSSGVIRRLAVVLVSCLACNGSHGSRGVGGSGAGHGGNAGTAGKAGDASAPRDAADPDGGICTYDPTVTPPAGCAVAVPSACPDPAPSYKDSVSSIFASYCMPCHFPGGMASDKLFDSYTHVRAVSKPTLITKVSTCAMPPQCAPQPSSAERLELLQWLVCAAPNN
jgi:hypothetical protein